MIASEHGAPGQTLEEDATKSEDVGACVDIAFARDLLGRHIADGADHRARTRNGPCTELVSRDAEVDELHRRRFFTDEEHVRRFHVAVYDAANVRRTEPGCHPSREHERIVGIEWRSVEAFAQVFALEPFHREVGGRTGRRRERPVSDVDRCDAMRDVANDRGVLQVREKTRFLREAIGVGAVREVHLQRDGVA